MEFLNPSRCVEDLRAGRVNEYESMKYMMATVLLEISGGSGAFSHLKGQAWWVWLLGVLILLTVNFWGLRRCYAANGGAQGQDFIKRYVCIGVPLGVFFGFLILLGLLLVIPFTMLFSGQSAESSPVVNAVLVLVVGPFLTGVFYEWKSRLLERVASI